MQADLGPFIDGPPPVPQSWLLLSRAHPELGVNPCNRLNRLDRCGPGGAVRGDQALGIVVGNGEQREACPADRGFIYEDYVSCDLAKGHPGTWHYERPHWPGGPDRGVWFTVT